MSGDTISLNGIMSDEANKEVDEYLKMTKSIVKLDGTFLKSAATALTELTIFNLTRIP